MEEAKIFGMKMSSAVTILCILVVLLIILIIFIIHKMNVRARKYEMLMSGKKGEDLDENLRLKSVVPFQLAYDVSIHKEQGLEYDSVKVIIPSNNAEKITHGIFYTAITRAKTNLKIYWSSESMHDVVKGFATDESKRKSLEIVKTKLGKN